MKPKKMRGVRIDDRKWKVIKKAAKRAGVSCSCWIRMAIEEKMGRGEC